MVTPSLGTSDLTLHALRYIKERIELQFFAAKRPIGAIILGLVFIVVGVILAVLNPETAGSILLALLIFGIPGLYFIAAGVVTKVRLSK